MRHLALPLWCTLLCSSTLAGAQTPKSPPQEADRLFKEGRALLAQKKYAEACPKLEKSIAFEPALGALLNLADCFEQSGKPARAFVLFNDAAAWAARNHETKREEVAQQRAQALKAKLPFLVVELQAPIAAARANVFTAAANAQGEPLISWVLEGAPQSVPLDAGAYEVEVSAPGRKPVRLKVEVPAAPGTVRLQVPPLEVDAPVMDPSLVPPPPPPLLAARGEVTRPGRSTSWTLGIADVSLGGALLAGSVIGLAYTGTIVARTNRQQPGGADAGNPTVTRRDFELARTLYYVSWAALGVGVLALGSGAWLLIREPAHAGFSALVTSDGAFATVQGSF